jgi:hypothetical protein
VERRLAELQSDLEKHRNDSYAHSPMWGRVMQENLSLRERFENRLNSLERFRAQATMVGGIGLLILGATASAVAFKFLGVH